MMAPMIGDKVTLRDYSRYEYPQYKGQTCQVFGTVNGSMFSYQVRWSNGDVSHIHRDNIAEVFPAIRAYNYPPPYQGECKLSGVPFDCGQIIQAIKTDNIQKPMIKKLSNFIKKTVNADTQELLKAGLINGDLEPTCTGMNELNQILWFANIAELVARAKEINKENDEAAKKQ